LREAVGVQPRRSTYCLRDIILRMSGIKLHCGRTLPVELHRRLNPGCRIDILLIKS
jgi:hypothetical protein